jgi:dethiobiotin synthetase
MGRLVVVSGTGTEIGKTHVSEAILLTWRAQGVRAVGVKPVESGVVTSAPPGAGGPPVRSPQDSDAARLARASAFHVKPFGYVFPDPISPHLAARRQRTTIRPEPIVEGVRALLPAADVVLVELPGGLFSPLAEGLFNADLAAGLQPDALLLVAPDRLGVLHEVVASTRAATTAKLRVDGIVLVAPDQGDASTGSNAGELARFAAPPVLASTGRGTPAELALTPALQRLVAALPR